MAVWPSNNSTGVMKCNKTGYGYGLIMELCHIRVSQHCISRYITVTVTKSSCTRVTRQSASVIKVGVACVNVHISRS